MFELPWLLGFRMLTVGTAIFHLLHFDCICCLLYSRILLEAVEKYSEGKIHKSEPEPRNSNVNTAYFIHQGITRISRTEFVMINKRTIANVCLYLRFQLE